MLDIIPFIIIGLLLGWPIAIIIACIIYGGLLLANWLYK